MRLPRPPVQMQLAADFGAALVTPRPLAQACGPAPLAGAVSP